MKFFIFLLLAFSSLSCTQRSSTDIDLMAKREFPVNEKINPCDNFYEYACSKVKEGFKLREDRSRHAFSFNDASDRILEFKKSYFKKIIKLSPIDTKEKQVRRIYMSCMDKSSRISEEKEYVQKILSQMNEIKTIPEYLKLVSRNIMTPNFSFIKYDTISNQQDPAKYDLYKDVFTMLLPDVTYYKKKDVINGYEETAIQFFIAIGHSDPIKAAASIVDYEKKFAKHFPERKEIRNLITKKIKISKRKMNVGYPNLLMKNSLSQLPEAIKFRSLWPQSLKFMNDYLEKADLTTLKNIYIYYSLQGHLDDAYPTYFKSYFNFRNKYLGGAPKRTERAERCTKFVMRKFSKELDYALVPLMFPDFPKQKFIDLAEKVRASLSIQIEDNLWLASKTKREALRKIKTAKLQLVTPDSDEEWDFIPDGKYSETKFIQNKLERKSLIHKKMMVDLVKGSNRNAWGMSPLTVNAYYSPPFNKFVLPLAILQYPFYDPSLPEEVNLGAIGAVVGHELGHGVDDKGSKYNADGVLKNWFTKNDLKNFKKRTKSLVEQWNKIGEDGKFKLGENIGDLVGVTSSYKAAFGSGKTKSKKLQQEFFLQYARAWCEVQRPKMAEKRLKTDPHSASLHRVNEQVKHQLGFEKAFMCKQGDKMTLPNNKRVKIW